MNVFISLVRYRANATASLSFIVLWNVIMRSKYGKSIFNIGGSRIAHHRKAPAAARFYCVGIVSFHLIWIILIVFTFELWFYLKNNKINHPRERAIWFRLRCSSDWIKIRISMSGTKSCFIWILNRQMSCPLGRVHKSTVAMCDHGGGGQSPRREKIRTKAMPSVQRSRDASIRPSKLMCNIASCVDRIKKIIIQINFILQIENASCWQNLSISQF